VLSGVKIESDDRCFITVTIIVVIIFVVDTAVGAADVRAPRGQVVQGGNSSTASR